MERIITISALLCCLVAGCGEPRFKAGTVKELTAERDEIAKKLPEAEAAQFVQASTALMAMAAVETEAAGDKQDGLIAAKFRGKTPKELIDQYEKIDPAMRAQWGLAVTQAKTNAAEYSFRNSGDMAKADARARLAKVYFGTPSANGGSLKNYQIYLREAQQAFTRGDAKAERTYYQTVLNLLRDESFRSSGRSLTGMSDCPKGDPTIACDPDLEYQISIILVGQ